MSNRAVPTPSIHIVVGQRDGWSEHLTTQTPDGRVTTVVLAFDRFSVETLAGVCRSTGARLVLPTTKEQALWLVRNGSALRQNPNLSDLVLLGPTSDTSIETLANKWLFYEALRTSPALAAFVPRHFANDEKEPPPLPVIFKPALGQYGIGCSVVTEATYWSENQAYFTDTHGAQGFVQQEYLWGREYTLHLWVDAGARNVLWSLCLAWDPPAGQTFVKGIDQEHLRVEPRRETAALHHQVAILQILRHVGFGGGICSCNYKISPSDGQVRVLEINPRIGGSLVTEPEYFRSLLQMIALL